MDKFTVVILYVITFYLHLPREWTYVKSRLIGNIYGNITFDRTLYYHILHFFMGNKKMKKNLLHLFPIKQISQKHNSSFYIKVQLVSQQVA